jgi:hypothetical protein
MLWVVRWLRRQTSSLGLLVRTIADVTRPADAHGQLRQVK